MTRAVLQVGIAPSPRTQGPITRTDIVRFAGAGGDFNPLHHDTDYARRAGLDDVIAMGQMQAGMLAAWVTDTVGIENLVKLSVRFVAPVRVGDVLTFSGTVDSVQDGLADLTLEATADGRTVVSGTARARVETAAPESA